MVKGYYRPRDAAEALSLLGSKPGSTALGGGTQLLSGEYRHLDLELVSLEGLLPRSVARSGERLSIGAGATFQDLADAPGLPEPLKAAVLGMVDRNVRNRATVGGNLGADKSCSSLLPLLLALDADIELLDGRKLRLEKWLDLAAGPEGRGIVATVTIPLAPGVLAGYARWSRTACDLSVLGVGLAFRLEKGLVRNLRLVLGGMGPRARRFPSLEALYEGRALPGRDAIEAAAGPLLEPLGDVRAGAEFKRLRASVLVADALLGAKDISKEVLP